LRIKIPGAADIPPPAIAPIMHFMAPASAFPGHTAVIGVPAEIAGWCAACETPALGPPARHSRGASWACWTRLSWSCLSWNCLSWTCLPRTWLPGARRMSTLDCRLGRASLRRGSFRGFLRLRRQRKRGHDRHQRKDDPRAPGRALERAPERTFGFVSGCVHVHAASNALPQVRKAVFRKAL
jgi:hypothetical protein